MSNDFDVSKLENTGWRFFRKQMVEYYRYEFKQLSLEYKTQAIDYVIEHNAEIFTRDFVLAENLCHKCGICCQEIGCVDFNPETKLCTKHNDQNTEMCSEYPWSEVGLVLTYNCGYQRDIFIRYMNMYFEKTLQMMKPQPDRRLRQVVNLAGDKKEEERYKGYLDEKENV